MDNGIYKAVSYSNEIQIEIDDVYACPGHCPGCVLSSIERKSQEPDMKFDILTESISKLIKYVPTLHNLEKINLTYGIADHFMMSNEYLAKLYHLGADLIEKTGLKNQYNGVFFTASMIGKHELIMEKVKFLHEESKKRNIPFYVIAVLDPKNLYHKTFADVYKRNIIETNKLIKKVDLSINLSDSAIQNITPEDLYNFALENEFDEVTINWTPTEDNIKFVYFNQQILVKWLIDFDNLISTNEKLSTSYRPVIKKTINNLMCKTSDYIDNSFQEDIKMHLHELVKKSIQIDNNGNIFPKYEAIGDVAHTPRLGIKAWGNIVDNKSIEDIINEGLLETEKFVIKQFTQEPCMSCEYNRFCANSGFHIYNFILNKSDITKEEKDKNLTEMGCYHPAKSLFKHYYSQMEKEILK
jgi:hypothetical protein